MLIVGMGLNSNFNCDQVEFGGFFCFNRSYVSVLGYGGAVG